jgi:uncharacterized membrane protein YcaP (DUF421 family)
VDWNLIFAPHLPLLEGVVRGTVTYLALLALLRVVGRRETGGLGLTDVLVVVLVADAASAGLYGETTSLADGMVVVVTILFWSVVVDAVAYRFPKLATLLKATPKTLIENGKLNRAVMRRELMTTEEVSSQLRLHGIDDIAMVERACIEPNGMISVIRRDQRDTSAVESPEPL